MRKVARLGGLPLRVAACLVLLVAIVGLAAAAIAGHQESRDKARFNNSLWRRPVPHCARSRRGRIVDDLVANHLRIGMRMDRVQSLLGKPDGLPADNVWFYNVSAADQGYLLTTCIGLKLEEQGGRLERVRITRDNLFD